MQRGFVERVKYWIENHASFLGQRLREERRKKETSVDKRDATWWDSFESWKDKVDSSPYGSGERLSQLFSKPSVDRSHDYFHPPLDGEMVKLNSVRCEVTGSSEELVDLVRNKGVFKLFIGDMEHFMAPVSYINRPDTITFARPLVLPPRQHFYADVNMPSDVVKRISELREKVGPGSGWVSIRIILGVTLIRTWFQ